MMVNASGQHDLLAAQCSCSQCGQNLSSMAYQRRVAHIKKCEPPSSWPCNTGSACLLTQAHSLCRKYMLNMNLCDKDDSRLK